MSSYCNPYRTHFTGEKLKLQLKNLSSLLSRYYGIMVSWYLDTMIPCSLLADIEQPLTGRNLIKPTDLFPK
jgi:hypothetical protein